jgi:SnoaL-like domain
MAIHRNIFPEEAADRLALRELVDAYAHCADRRDAKGQMALFTEDARFVVYMDASDIPSQELQGRDALAPALDNLNQMRPQLTSTARAPLYGIAVKQLVSAIAWRIMYRYMEESVNS